MMGLMDIETVDIDSISPDPANVRLHPERNLDAIKASLRRFGQQKPIVVDGDGVVRAGNGTLAAAKSLGWGCINIVRTDLTGSEATAFAIADNRTGELAEWDADALGRLLSELEQHESGIGMGLGFSADDLAVMPNFDGVEAAAENAEIDARDATFVENTTLPPVSALGDLWLLGDHRLLCGDSTKPESYVTLMQGEKATLLATDPPYLVDYTGSSHPADHHVKAGRVAAPGKEVGNKHWDAYTDPEASVDFFSVFLRLALEHCIERVPVYQWHASRRQALVEAAWKANGLLLHQTIIWVKSRPVLTRSHYLWQHEPCFYGWPEGKMPEKGRRPATTSTTVWSIPNASGEERADHPTPKPLEIFTRPISAHTRSGEVCLEPFSGGGAQIIAAEKTNRKCYAIELSPTFVDVAVRRWQNATGLDALRSDGVKFNDVEATL